MCDGPSVPDAVCDGPSVPDAVFDAGLFPSVPSLIDDIGLFPSVPNLIDDAGLDALCNDTSDVIIPKDYDKLVKRPAACTKRPAAAPAHITMKRPAAAPAHITEAEDRFDDTLAPYLNAPCSCAAELSKIEKRAYSKVFHMAEGEQRKEWGRQALQRFRFLKARSYG